MPDPSVTAQIVVNLLIIALGYLIKKVGLVSRQEGSVLSRIVLYITLPALTVQAMLGAQLAWDLAILPLLFTLLPALMCLLGLLLGRAMRLSRPDLGTFAVSLCGFMGSLVYPFVEVAFGQEGIRALAFCDIGNGIAIFGIAYAVAMHYGKSNHSSWKEILFRILRFFPLQVMVVALLLNVAGVRLSGAIEAGVSTLAAANSSLMLLSLGVYLEVNLSRQEAKLLTVHTVFKYAAGLAIALLALLAVPYRGPMRAVTFLLPLAPTSLSTLVYSVEHDLNPRLAAMLVSQSILISLGIMTITLIAFRRTF